MSLTPAIAGMASADHGDSGQSISTACILLVAGSDPHARMQEMCPEAGSVGLFGQLDASPSILVEQVADPGWIGGARKVKERIERSWNSVRCRQVACTHLCITTLRAS